VIGPVLDEQAEDHQFQAGQAVQVTGRGYRNDRRHVARHIGWAGQHGDPGVPVGGLLAGAAT
jgi:hypothetical protein